MPASPKTPTTVAEWQEAVDLAHGCMLIDSARKYGLVSGGPEVDLARCEEILALGRRRGITPRADAVERTLADLARAQA